MSLARPSMVVLTLTLLRASVVDAQVPDDLRAAMQARDRAFYPVNAAEWERYTAPAFTTVQQDGSFLTRAERLVSLKTQSPRPYVPRSREVNHDRPCRTTCRWWFACSPTTRGHRRSRTR